MFWRRIWITSSHAESEMCMRSVRVAICWCAHDMLPGRMEYVPHETGLCEKWRCSLWEMCAVIYGPIAFHIAMQKSERLQRLNIPK